MAFEYSFEYLEDKFVENKEFIKQLIKNYFILSKELKTRIFNNQEENEKSKIVKCIDILNENEINQHIFTNDRMKFLFIIKTKIIKKTFIIIYTILKSKYLI